MNQRHTALYERGQDMATEQTVLRLHRNENPYGCSLLVRESLSISDNLSTVPGALPLTLQRSLERYTGRPSAETHLADSPVELLSRVLNVLAAASPQLVAVGPLDWWIRTALRQAGIWTDELALPPDGELRVDQLLARTDPERLMVILGAPNAVTGSLPSAADVVTLLRAGVTVISDETYAEFSDRSLGMLGREFPGLVSLRSFAPWAGLWGIPVSYALASPELVGALESRYSPEQLTVASRVAAGASLDDARQLQGRVRQLRVERSRLYRRLRKLNFVQPMHSGGPFLCCAVTRGAPAAVCELLEREGVLIHDCTGDGLPGHVRISVGTAEHTDALIAAMCRISVEL